MLTAVATILFMVLIETTLDYSKSSSSYSKRVSDMLVSEKLGYTFDDITEDITNITGLSITQQQADLIFRDSFPGAGITDRLAHYEDFMRARYLTPDMEVTFLNPADQPISLNSLSSQITVQPFNMTYKYTDFAKTDLFVQIPYDKSNAIQFVWYNMTITNGNFSKDVSQIDWSPKPWPTCECTPGTPGCIRFYLRVNDSAGNEYISPYDTFSVDCRHSDLKIDFVNQTCWIAMWVGESVGEQYILNLKTQNCQIESEIGFTFNTTNFWLDFPTKLKVRDVNYNTSRKDSISLVITRLLK
ncbi:MAG: hypothetical protein Sv326_0162 [Candidatus Fermentimicrarchaeum limneticum]|uniref:Uncharacterized protein n=1 Tax=Fermentimicrarchaeum limneticum TaxID=2795018 RepID=A0A7D6B9K6_FERL1|nr:MAG: hypothetical protein Sv326_0162 [Candidatus Fermentimicrarchaeum limneticum]